LLNRPQCFGEAQARRRQGTGFSHSLDAAAALHDILEAETWHILHWRSRTPWEQC
jgi:hypothetical protein